MEKGVWNLIENGARPEPAPFWEQRSKENRMAVGTATRIIKEGVSDDIFNNIIDITDTREMWEKLRTACSQVGQGVVYSILQELLNYRNTKPKGFEKSVMSIFADVCFLVKRLRSAITPNRDIWDSIAIIVALDSLHDDFETTTTSMLERGDKTIEEIQQILASAEAKFISKRATGVTADLAMSSRGKNAGKRKATSEDRCYNCHKFGHFGRDCRSTDQRPPEPKKPKSTELATRQQNTRNRAHLAAATADEDSDPEPFRPGAANMVKKTRMQAPKSTWYLDSCASRHLTNNKDLFIDDLRPKYLDFTAAGGQILLSESIGTIAIPLVDGSSIELGNVAYGPDCDSNLISLGQLRESGITYVDDAEAMTLVQFGRTIAQARRDRNLFILDLATPNKAMQVTGRGRPTHLVSKNKRVRVWHRRFVHASNARIIRAPKLLTGMGDFNKEYDPTEIYSDSEQPSSDNDDAADLDQPDTTQTDQLPATSNTAMSSLLTTPDNDFDSLCTPCIASKQTRVVVQNKAMTKAKEKLDEVHVDLWGPHYPPSLSGKTYAAILVDANMRKSWVAYLRSKDEFVDAFQVWLPVVENQCSKSMKVLRADGGGEFISAKLKDFCDKKGITIKYAAPYMHEENGIAERGWKTIVMMKDSLLINSGLPLNFWAEAMETANYLRNRLPTKSQRGELIPEECWTGEKQDVSHIKVFGSVVSIAIPKEKRHKSDIYKNWKGIFIGYSDTTKHVRAWAPKTQLILIVSDPYIDESEQGAKLLIEHPLDLDRLSSSAENKRKAPTGESRPRGRLRKVAPIPITITTTPPAESGELPEDPAEGSGGRDDLSNEIRVNEKIMSATETSSKVHEPRTYEEAVSDPIYARQWKEAIEEEIQNLENHQTWEFDHLPADRKAVGSKWAFKVKYSPDGSIACYRR